MVIMAIFRRLSAIFARLNPFNRLYYNPEPILIAPFDWTKGKPGRMDGKS
jgi:hypothetical protein